MKPKVLVTTSTLPRWEHDQEPRFVLDLSKQLLGEFDITVLAPAAPTAKMEEWLDGVHIVRYRYAPLRMFERLAYPGSINAILKRHPSYWPLVPCLFAGLWAKIRQILRHSNIACVHAHWSIPQGFIQGAFFSGQKHPPYVITSHGGDAYTYFASPVKKQFVKIALRHASAITVVSRHLEQTIRKEFAEDAASRPLHIAPMGVSLERFHPNARREDWPALHGLTRPILLFVGRLAEKKGLSYLLQAMASPEIAKTTASLAIIGDGPLREQLERETAARLLTERVRFIGSLDHAQLPTAYASADIFCAPFIIAKDGDREGLPTVLSEAGASGLPSVASDVGGVAEILLHEQTGLVVPPQDVASLTAALLRLILEPQTRNKYGQQALTHAAQFSWNAIGHIYSHILREAIEARARRYAEQGA